MNFLRNQPEVGQYIVTSVFFLFVCFFYMWTFFNGLAGRWVLLSSLEEHQNEKLKVIAVAILFDALIF